MEGQSGAQLVVACSVCTYVQAREGEHCEMCYSTLPKPEAIVLQDPSNRFIPIGKVSKLSHAVCKIETRDGKGTGFLATWISRRGTALKCIFTNHHVLKSTEAARASGAIFYDADDQPKIRIHLRPDVYWVTDKTLDVTIVACELKDLPSTLHPIALDRDAMEKGVKVGEYLTILGHPGGGDKAMTRGPVDKMVGETIFHKANTLPGSSGSPIFAEPDWQLIGIHHSGDTIANQGSLLRSLLPQASPPPQPSAKVTISPILPPLKSDTRKTAPPLAAPRTPVTTGPQSSSIRALAAATQDPSIAARRLVIAQRSSSNLPSNPPAQRHAVPQPAQQSRPVSSSKPAPPSTPPNPRSLSSSSPSNSAKPQPRVSAAALYMSSRSKPSGAVSSAAGSASPPSVPSNNRPPTPPKAAPALSRLSSSGPATTSSQPVHKPSPMQLTLTSPAYVAPSPPPSIKVEAILYHWDGNSWTEKHTRIEVHDPGPISHGSHRMVYRVRMDDGEYAVKTIRPELRSRVSDLRRYYMEEVVEQYYCIKMAGLWNEEQQRDTTGRVKRVAFNVIAVIAVPSQELIGLIEPFMHGTYRKYNDNNGNIFKDQGAELARWTPQAFSHFSFNRSQGHTLICDLQGIEFPDTDVYTDPCVHRRGATFVLPGNLQDQGMLAFFRTHVCNDVCRAMQLTLPSFK